MGYSPRVTSVEQSPHPEKPERVKEPAKRHRDENEGRVTLSFSEINEIVIAVHSVTEEKSETKRIEKVRAVYEAKGIALPALSTVHSYMQKDKHKPGFYQKLVNSDRGRDMRNRVLTTHGPGCDVVQSRLLTLVHQCKRITRSMVLDYLRQECHVGAAAVEELYGRFRKHYGWVWRRYGRKKSMFQGDIDKRLVNWSRECFFAHDLHQFNFAVFGDETCIWTEGEQKGLTLAPRGMQDAPKVEEQKAKDTVTGFFCGISGIFVASTWTVSPTFLKNG